MSDLPQPRKKRGDPGCASLRQEEVQQGEVTFVRASPVALGLWVDSLLWNSKSTLRGEFLQTLTLFLQSSQGSFVKSLCISVALRGYTHLFSQQSSLWGECLHFFKELLSISLYSTPWTPVMSKLGGQRWACVVQWGPLQLAVSPKLLVGHIFLGSCRDGRADVASWERFQALLSLPHGFLGCAARWMVLGGVLCIAGPGCWVLAAGACVGLGWLLMSLQRCLPIQLYLLNNF